MRRRKRFDSCIKDAFEILSKAREAHEEARGIVSPAPRVDKYQEASEHYERAAFGFAECCQSAKALADKKMAEAWQHYCLAMQHGDRANGRYFNPSADRQSIVDDTATAISYIAHAQENMPWDEVKQRDGQVRWKTLEYSFGGLMYRAKAQKLQQERKYKEAAEGFLIAADTHSKAATLADSLGDQVTYQRIMARVWSATSGAFDCRASMSKGKEEERYLNEAEKAARQAIEFRPQWTPLQQVFAEIILKQEQAERKEAFRIAWVQVFIGFVLGLSADLILHFFL